MKVRVAQIESVVQWFDHPLPRTGIEVAWAGQAGFLIKTPQMRIGIDLYLSNSVEEEGGAEFNNRRMMAPPITAGELGTLDLLLATHAHSDHLDPNTLAPLYSQKNAPLLILPRYEASQALAMGVPAQTLLPLNAGESITLAEDIIIHAIAAAHTEITRDSHNNIEALGYILEVGDISLYHSGDTLTYPDLLPTLKKYNPTVYLLPVNGRSDELTAKGIIGNLTIEEASTLAREGGATLLIPHHFGMFEYNTVPVETIREKLTAQGWKEGEDLIIPSINEVYVIS
jgi:L-ascorbate metabolism protein UlaG (beta-lactamase superfamily)